MKQPHATRFHHLRALCKAGAISALTTASLSAQISPPEGSLGEKAVFTAAVGGEQLTRATAAGATGPSLTQTFDTAVSVASSHELDAGQIKLSSGRHLVIYDTRFDASGGANRAEIQTALNLAGSRLVAGRSQGYIRRTAGADETVLSGGAIITVASSGDVLTLESWRTDNNTNASVLPTRVANGTAVQLMRLDDSWDFLSLERSANQAGAIGTSFVDVAYDNNASPGTEGASFSVSGGDVTLNETGLYLVFANTSIQKAANTTRTNYQQRLTLDGSAVAGSTTTTYVRGNEDSNEGMASLGMVLSATAGQVLNVEVIMESGGNATGLIQGGETALTMVKLPPTAEYLSLMDTTNQEVNDAALDPVVYNTQVDASSSLFSHTVGGSAVTVNEDADYLFFGSIFTQSDTATNDNHDRTVPLQGWQIDGAGGRINWGRGAQYNRDSGGARTAGSWGAAMISLTAAQTVELTTERIAHTDVGMTTSIAGLQALSCKSLLPSPDPLIVRNSQLSLVVSTTGTIDDSLLLTVDADDVPADLTYTVNNVPTAGILMKGGVPINLFSTFTQEDLNNGEITFEAGAVTTTGGFNFQVADDSGSGNIETGTFVVSVGLATMLTDDVGATDEDTVYSAAAPGVLSNDSGSDLSVTAFDAVSPQGAAVNITSNGSISYDPTAALALQALDDGDSVIDTFTYTVTDFSSATTTANVSVTVDGLNDAPVVVNDSATGSDIAGPSFNVLANDSDVDANDTITVVSLDGNPVGLGGLTILSGEEATITINPDGSFSYDPSTSADIAALGNGNSMVDTFTYEVSDGTATVAGTISITSVGSVGASNDVGLIAANATGIINVLGNDDIFGAVGTPTAGAVTDFNASDVGNSDGTWTNNGTGGGENLTMEGAGTETVLNTSLTGAPVGVTAAYDLSGTGSGVQINATDTLPNIYGSNISASNATIELVFRPDDLVGPEPLWGTGGNGTGASIVLLDDQLIFTAGQGAVVLQAVGTITNTDYVHVLVSIDLAADTAELYLNNSLVDTGNAINITTGAPANITDWSGTDAEGIGRSAGTTGGDVNISPFLGSFGTVDIPDFNDGVDRFDGELAVVRVYSGTLLDATGRADNFSAIFGASSTPVVGDIVDLAGESTLVPGTTVVNLPSGATVKLESDGTLTYDPNGAFDDLASGLETTDSFTYTLSGSSFVTATVTARITGTNPDPQISIAADQNNVTEGDPASFTITAASAVGSDVTVNLSYSGTAQDGSDFNGQASRTITSGTNSVDLDLVTIADSLFEGGSETIIVSIDSISGPATLSPSLTAGTLLDDGDAAPEFTITGGGAVTEGSVVSFTVVASVASSAAATIDLGYSGTSDSADFSPLLQVTIPAMTTSETLNMLVFDDGVSDSGETIIATISNPSLGSVGASDNATATTNDGAGQAVFFADFEGVNPGDTPGGTLLNTDAPSAANLGTSIGHWANVLTAASGGAAPGLINEVDDVRGDGNDTMLRQDRPANAAQGEISAVFDGVIDLSGGNTGTVSFDLGHLRTLTPDKNSRIIGLDPAGNKSFELLINGANGGPDGKSLFHVDSVGALTQLSSFNTIPNSQDIAGSAGNAESAHVNIRLGLTASGYTVALDHPTIVGGVATPALDGVPDMVTGELAYAGSATLVSKILFQIAGSTDVNFNGGLLFDNVTAAGTSIGTQEAWRLVYYGSTANSGPGADSATAVNGLTNLMNFALGLDPTILAGVLDVDTVAGTITTLGPPVVWVDPATGQIYLRHTRRSDFAEAGISIFDQFSRNLSLPFEDSVVAPEVIATGANGGVSIEAVQTEFPLDLPISGGKGRYGRVNASVGP